MALFATAFPLAAAASMVCNLIEVRSDALKLLYVTRRPSARRVEDMGAWSTVLRIIAYGAVLTNVALLTFTSSQVKAWLPDLFTVGTQYAIAKLGHGRYLLLLAGLAEHMLLLLGCILEAAVPAIPSDVSDELERIAYEDQREAREAHRRQLSSKSSKSNKKDN